MTIRPLDCTEVMIRAESAKPVMMKSRLRRFFDRPFTCLMTDKCVVGDESSEICIGEVELSDDQFEPSSVCLTKMVNNFIEESNEKPAAAVKCGRSCCSCIHGNNDYSSDDEFDVFDNSGDSIHSFDSIGILKSLIPCTSAAERNLLADAAEIINNDNKPIKRKDDLIKIVVDGLTSIGYTASICKSRWVKSASHPAGEYEYIHAIVGEERLLIDVDFKSEFEMARSTSKYKDILHLLPYIFIGKSDRLQQIVSIVSEAAKQSLMKKDMFFPPWRKAEYMKAKWLSPYTTAKETTAVAAVDSHSSSPFSENELIFGDEMSLTDTVSGNSSESSPVRRCVEDGKKSLVVVSPWQPPAIKPRSFDKGAKVVTGLAFLLQEKS